MKIYFILIDAMTRDHAEKLPLDGFNYHEGIATGTFTVPSLKGMFDGSLPSDYNNGEGSGYSNCRDLTYLTREKNILHHIKNHSDFDFLSLHRADLKDFGAEPDIEFVPKHVKLVNDRPYAVDIMDWDNEIEWLYLEDQIGKIQKRNGNNFVFACNWIFHEFMYLDPGNMDKGIEHINKWLSLWNFNEPESIFIIFSDHEPHTPTDLMSGFYNWYHIKDNTGNFKFKDRTIYGMDIYDTLIDILGFDIPESRYGTSMFKDDDKNRLMFIEDSRGGKGIKRDVSQSVAIIDKNGNITSCERYSGPQKFHNNSDRDYSEELRKAIKWVD